MSKSLNERLITIENSVPRSGGKHLIMLTNAKYQPRETLFKELNTLRKNANSPRSSNKPFEVYKVEAINDIDTVLRSKRGIYNSFIYLLPTVAIKDLGTLYEDNNPNTEILVQELRLLQDRFPIMGKRIIFLTYNGRGYNINTSRSSKKIKRLLELIEST